MFTFDSTEWATLWTHILDNFCNLHTSNAVLAMDLVFESFFQCHFLLFDEKSKNVKISNSCHFWSNFFTCVSKKNNLIQIEFNFPSKPTVYMYFYKNISNFKIMLYVCEEKSIVKMDTDVFLFSFSFKLMAQYISHTSPLFKTAKPKKNSII